jgi:quinol monooxygenase YgiN
MAYLDVSRRYRERGCEQFGVFQSVVNPDKLAIPERWTD